MSNQDDLQQIANDIVNSNVCPELRDGATQLVFADGNPDAEIVFIGEAPGKNEDQKGIPFIGAAGKFLDEMLATIGLKREDIYITNIVKYRPPNNRDPLPEEKKAFWPYLVRQLDVIKPKLVVTLGRHSMEYFLPEQKISQVHGEPKRIAFGERKQVIMPLFHPAAALYNGSLRQTLIDDFSRIPAIISKI
jgi:DNA polymerase